MSKSMAEVDKNFANINKKYQDIKFFDILEDPFVIDGLYRPKETGIYTRLPMEFKESDKLNDMAKVVMTNTAGGRIRFITDSPYIALGVQLGEISYVTHHMADTGVMDFDMYALDEGSSDEPAFAKIFIPEVDENKRYSGTYEFRCTKSREITINFPLSHDVKSVHIGLKEGCKLNELPYGMN